MLQNGRECPQYLDLISWIQFQEFCRFISFVERYQSVEPLMKEKDVAYESLTYYSKLYVATILIWKISKDMQQQPLLIEAFL